MGGGNDKIEAHGEHLGRFFFVTLTHVHTQTNALTGLCDHLQVYSFWLVFKLLQL